MSSDPLTIKLLVVGDGSVGKTCILLSYTTDKFPTEYVPTVFENYQSQVTVNGQQINLNLWDTAGQETYNQLRTLSYDNTDIFLIIFSVVEESSFQNALHKWLPELSKDKFANTPKLIIGNKTDMRDETNAKHIRTETAKQLTEQQGAKYFECSALTQDGLKPLFDEAIKSGIKYRQDLLNAQNQPSKPVQNNNNSSCCNLI